MSKLTDTQFAVLSSAAIHEAGIAARPDKLKPAAAAKLAASLISSRYVREVQAKTGWPIWRKDDAGKAYSLKILSAGKAALAAASDESISSGADQQQPRAAATTVATSREIAPSGSSEIAPRGSSKIGGIVAMLERSGGATADEMIAATGWLPHTLRAAMTGLRKRGYDVERFRNDSAASAYRIASGVVAAAA